MRTITKITVSELETILRNLPAGGNFVSVQMATDPKMRKTGNPFFGRVKKHAIVNCQIQADYENAVNAKRTREGLTADFQAAPRTWGQRIGNTCLIEHKDKMYMAFRALKCLKTTYRDLQGRFLPRRDVESLKDYLQKSTSNRQQTDTEIVWRTVTLDNIRRININKQRFEITS